MFSNTSDTSAYIIHNALVLPHTLLTLPSFLPMLLCSSQQCVQCNGTACPSAAVSRPAAVAAGPQHSIQGNRSTTAHHIEGSSGILAEVRQRTHTGDSEGQQLLTVDSVVD